MANPGVGNRFASVNLNKSYGHASHPNQSNNNGYGFGRGRSGSGGGGGGMVVLSRPRSSHKAAPKLSVPPPLNLPSLRKEHEKFDTLGAGGGVGGSVGAGSGARPSSSGVGWSKPSAVVAVESEDAAAAADDRPLSSQGVKTVDVVSRGGASSAYMPPSARGGVGGADVSVAAPVEKVSVLRGEDFPSLRATLNAANSQTQKQKDSVQQKHKQGIREEPSGGLREGYQASSEVAMRPQVQYFQSAVDTGGSNVGGDIQNGGSSRPQEQVRKQDDYFPGPLPLVRVSPRSDWADDERDTSHGLTSRSRDQGYSRTEAYWDRDFDFPRNSFMPHKPAQYQFDRRGQRDNDVGKGLSNEVFNADPFARDARTPGRDSREGHTWRNSSGKDAFGSQDVSNDRYNLGARPINVNREMNKENKYTPPQLGGITNNEHTSGGVSGSRDLGTGRRDQVYKHSGRQQWNNMGDTNNGRGPERDYQERFVSDSNRYRADFALNKMGSRPSFSGSSKGFSASDHLPNFSREKRSFSKSEKPYGEDPFLGSTRFDAQDPFSGGILGVIKRKKDSNKQLDFHDPVRESFEAELERVQKIQEQERQRVIEEQERAMELARREEEERLRVVREQEERQRRLEEEAREAAWRAEQERAEAIQKAEELKSAREEEKQRLMMEEERRKQAAKQKLLELEEKIARRQAESSKADSSAATPGDNMTGVVKDRDLSRADDFASWEDGERMVERITNSASSDSSLSRPFDMGPRAAPVRDGSFGFTDRGKSFNSWRRDIFDNDNNSSFFSADHENGHLSPRRDTAIGGRSFPRKDLYAGQGYMPTRGHYRGRIPEPHLDDISHARGHRWNISEGDPYGRNMELDTDFHDNVGDRFDVAWGQGQHIQSQGRGGYSSFPERLYQNSDLDEFYSYGRSRYPARQPRVLPPPVLSSGHRASFRSESCCPGSSSYENRDVHFDHALQGDSTAGNYPHAHEENSGTIDDEEQSARNEEQELNRQTVPGCDSQSSLSVSSPPSSPTQLSHDDFDESREFVSVSGVAEGQNISVVENETVILAGKRNTATAASSISVGDDEEWAVENNEESQEHDEYDEDVGYHENELHGGQGESGELTQEFEEMHLEGKDSSDTAENMVLGFDQGVEVGIPSDDYAKSPRLDDSLCVGIQGNIDIVDQNNSFDGRREGQSPDVADVSQHVAASSTSTIAENTEKALEGLVSVPNDASAPSRVSLDPSATGDLSSCSVLHSQQSVSPHRATDAHSSNQAVANVGGAQAQGTTELPKLQFGLFSGPSLIPSPVPAIQIGSIQMPLQLHPQVGPPLPHMHASQPPLFQFGQLSYPSPMSQGILSLAPQPVTYVQPNVPHSFPASQVSKGPLAAQNSSSHSSVTNNVPSFTVNSHHFQPSNQSSVCQETELKEANVLAAPTAESKVISRQNQVDASRASVCAVRPELGRRTDSTAPSHNSVRNSKPFSHHRGSESRPQGRSSSSQSASNARNSSGSVAHQFSSSRGRRYAYSSRNSGARLTSPANEVSRLDGNGFQRRPRRVTQRFEFRVRQTTDGRQSGADAQSNYDAKDSRTQRKSGVDMDIQSDNGKHTGDSSSDKYLTQDTVSAIENSKSAGKHAATDSSHTFARPEGSLKRNISSENDADAPLQSGVVRVYQQPGIEAPSDEDDFIEVRSKRQMLNDRREQREKEIKAKSSNMRKPQRKTRSAPQGTANPARTSRTSPSSAPAAKNIRAAVTSKRGLQNNEGSAAFNNVVSQPLAPIGTGPLSTDSQDNAKALTAKPVQTSSYTMAKRAVGPDSLGLTLDGSRKVDGAQSSLGSWGGSCTNQSVMSLTQTQLEEAMKPACFDSNVVPVGDQSSSVSEPILPLSAVPTKATTFSPAASPISSLLAGEKIQFGAVTSPTILTSSTRVASQGIRSAPSSLDMRVSLSMPASENNSGNPFDKEKHLNESCRPLEDCEAEAAASAVAVAAIGNDEVVGNAISSCSSVITDPKRFGSAVRDGITTGMAGDQHTASQSKAEETLSVSLPADLSVETSPISIWPPLPSPHSSSGQMLSPFPGGPASHFPFYDMNQMMGSPVFAFGPGEESGGPPPQPQKTSTPSSGPLGTWQQCHTGVDSFYGPPAGFTAPFISPPGSIPGVQGPPHMVVYNHFAPVGQFGQVGLSYMGTTYIPSGKQPDWKHNPASTTMGGGEVEINNLKMVPVQRNAPNVPAQVQHLAPGSPLLSIPSPLTMYEVSPFQASSDVSTHPRWSHVQAPPAHTIPQSVPLQQRAEIAVPSHFSHVSADHPSSTANGFSKLQTSSPLKDGRSFAVETNPGATEFPADIGLVDPPLPTGSEPSALNLVGKGRLRDSARVVSAAESSASKRNPQASAGGAHKTQSTQQKNASGQHHYSHYQRGGQKNSHGAEWSNRKMGFHGRNHSSGGDRTYPAKVKQVYVAKQSTSGTSTNAVS